MKRRGSRAGSAWMPVRREAILASMGSGSGPVTRRTVRARGTTGAYGSAVPEPVPRAADFLPGVGQGHLTPGSTQADGVPRGVTPRVHRRRAGEQPRGGCQREGGGGSRVGCRRDEDRGESNRGQPGGEPPLQLLRTHERAQAVVEWRITRRVTRAATAFGSPLAHASVQRPPHPSRNRSRPTSQPDSAWARSSPTQGGHHSRSRDGTPGGSGTRNERFNEDLASYFAAQGHGRSSGFIDKLSRRNSMDRDYRVERG
jgi:hypothetical protein